MKFDALDIIAGLEDAFFKAVQLVTNQHGTSLREHATPISRRTYTARFSKTGLRTLRSAYVALNPDRQVAWRKYGKPLNLSGFAAYVQVNAPRYRLGVVPERWPPVYLGNKVKNFDMFGAPPQYWIAGSAGFFLGNGHVSIVPATFAVYSLICKQDLILLPNTDYEVGFELYTYGNATGNIKFGLGSNLYTYDLGFNYPQGERILHTFTTPSSVGLLSIPVAFYTIGDNYKTYINNVTVIEV